MTLPKISVITVTYNAADAVRTTIESVLEQKGTEGAYTNLEYIVVDGASRDGTVAVIEQFCPVFEERGIDVKICSEPDKGIYDGMNKGIAMASGDWVYFLNAGDRLYSNDTLQCVQTYLDTSEADIVYGDICSVNGEEHYIMRSGSEPEELNSNLIFCHQAVFTRRILHERKMYSTDYRLASDYELFLYFYKNGVGFSRIPVVVAAFTLDGASNTNRKTLFLEYEKIHREYGIAAHGIKGAWQHMWGLFKICIADILPQQLVYRIMNCIINRD